MTLNLKSWLPCRQELLTVEGEAEKCNLPRPPGQVTQHKAQLALRTPGLSSQGLNSMPFPLAWQTDMAQSLRMFLS